MHGCDGHWVNSTDHLPQGAQELFQWPLFRVWSLSGPYQVLSTSSRTAEWAAWAPSQQFFWIPSLPPWLKQGGPCQINRQQRPLHHPISHTSKVCVTETLSLITSKYAWIEVNFERSRKFTFSRDMAQQLRGQLFFQNNSLESQHFLYGSKLSATPVPGGFLPPQALNVDGMQTHMQLKHSYT